MWVQFWDMHSGGGKKVSHEQIYIEANSRDEAIRIFSDKFNRDPLNVTCSCCGPDYVIYTDKCPSKLTAYHRNCNYNGVTEKWEESQDEQKMEIRKKCKIADSDPWGLYMTLEEYKKSPEVLFIYKSR